MKGYNAGSARALFDFREEGGGGRSVISPHGLFVENDVRLQGTPLDRHWIFCSSLCWKLVTLPRISGAGVPREFLSGKGLVGARAPRLPVEGGGGIDDLH